MTPHRFERITSVYAHLRIGVVGDFCLDRYLLIDPSLSENSLETGLPVHNVIQVRAQPGGAGTILNNLIALGVGQVFAVGFCGDDGEGYELRRALKALPGVCLDHFLTTADRRTFTYCKPLLIEPGKPPVELSRLDSKNWTRTPSQLEARLADQFKAVGESLDALIVLDQVDKRDTGVVTHSLLELIGAFAGSFPELPILADSRSGLDGWPPLSFKMNVAELDALIACGEKPTLDVVKFAAITLAASNQRPVFITLSEDGLVGADPEGGLEHVPALPVRGPIDIVGAGDAVTANLAAALASGATMREALEIAAIASSVVIHQLGTTGSATIKDLAAGLGSLGSGHGSS